MPFKICLTFDFDAVCIWPAVMNLSTPTPLSRGEFGARVAVPRILRILEREDVKATFFVPGHTIDSFPRVCNEIVEAGHEIGHHGYFHEAPGALSEDQERAMLEKGLDAMSRNLSGYVPTGYRSPAWDFSDNTADLLLAYGFRYDSSMMAQDFEPYWVRSGDECPHDSAFRPGREIDVVELPVSWPLDDIVQLEQIMSPTVFMPGVRSPRELRDQWVDDLDFAAQEVPDGVFIPTMHPQVIGRGARVRILEAIIARGKEHGSTFATCSDAAVSWAATAPEPGVPDYGADLQRRPTAETHSSSD